MGTRRDGRGQIGTPRQRCEDTEEQGRRDSEEDRETRSQEDEEGETQAKSYKERQTDTRAETDRQTQRRTDPSRGGAAPGGEDQADSAAHHGPEDGPAAPGLSPV